MRTCFLSFLAIAFIAGTASAQPLFQPAPQNPVYLPLVSQDRDLLAFTNYPPGGIGLYSVGVIQSDGSGYQQLTFTPGYSSPSWSPDGSQIVFYTPAGLSVMNADGSAVSPLMPENGPVIGFEPDWSPVGDRIAFTTSAGIFAINSDGSELVRLTDQDEDSFNPSWSPDGTQIAYTTWISGARAIRIRNLDGSGVYQLPGVPGAVYQPAWSPDGTRIAFPANFDGNIDIYTISPEGSGLAQLTDTPWPMLESQPAWSPDGKQVAFTLSNQTAGTFDIFIINVDGTGLRKLVTGAVDPDWSP
jgi:Tol biopolymer transport system component